MVVCPFCRAKVEKHKKEWYYRKGYYQVKAYDCPDCGSSFKAYFHENLLSHTIPKSLDPKSRLIHFLRKKPVGASQLEMAQTLGLDITEVSNILLELEKEGRVFMSYETKK